MKIMFNSEFAVEFKKAKYDRFTYMYLYVNDNSKWIKTKYFVKYSNSYLNDFVLPINYEVEKLIYDFKKGEKE